MGTEGRLIQESKNMILQILLEKGIPSKINDSDLCIEIAEAIAPKLAEIKHELNTVTVIAKGHTRRIENAKKSLKDVESYLEGWEGP